MSIENRLKSIQAALKQVDWFSTEEHINYDLDALSGTLFLEGKVVFYNDTVLEITESVTPDRRRYRYQYMHKDGRLIFRYDNVPHHRHIETFPHHKHLPDRVIESNAAELGEVVEEIIGVFAAS